MKTYSGKTIVYVNFSPYENAGNILDYLKSEFSRIILFSFNFHRLSETQEPSILSVYSGGKITYKTRLFQTPTSPATAFVLLPVRSLVIFLQLIFHLRRLTKRFGPFDVFFTVNAFTAWCGIFLKSLGYVGKTVFWVWDYYPPVHQNFIVNTMRYIYWRFDLYSTYHSDRIIFLNQRLIQYRKNIGVLDAGKNYRVVPIGTKPRQQKPIYKSVNQPVLTFFGVLKKSQGLDLVFDSAGLLMRIIPNLRIDVIGEGPDSKYFKKRAALSGLRVIFHGYIRDDRGVDRIIAGSDIGIATYIYNEANVSYYSDPSKIKRYIGCGVPVITTDVFTFSAEIRTAKAGIVIQYDTKDFVNAVKLILKHKPEYAGNALVLSRKYRYRTVYKGLFG